MFVNQIFIGIRHTALADAGGLTLSAVLGNTAKDRDKYEMS